MQPRTHNPGAWGRRLTWMALLVLGLGAPDRLAADDEAVRTGIHIEEVDRGFNETIGWMRIRARSDTPIRETWAVLSDVESWDTFMGYVPEVDRVESPADEPTYRITISPPWPVPDFHPTVTIHQPTDKRVLIWRVVDEELAGNFGKISAGEDPGGSWLLLEIYGPPQDRFPDWMVKIGVYFLMPALLKDIRGQVRKRFPPPGEEMRVPDPLSREHRSRRGIGPEPVSTRPGPPSFLTSRDAGGAGQGFSTTTDSITTSFTGTSR